MEDIRLAVVLGAALVDSINPCAIGVILFLSSVLLKISKRKTMLLRLGMVYIATVYVIYLLSGLGLIWFQQTLIAQGFAEAVGMTVGVFVIMLGLVELKDFFWYGRGFSLEIAQRHKEKLTKMTEQISFLGIIAIGGFVAVVELPCTGGPYLAITAMLADAFNLRAFVYLLIYNAIFVLPLIIILFTIFFGASTLELKRWRQENRKWMNLGSGLLMIGLGAALIGYYRFNWWHS